ncbi:phospholipase D family protein [Sphingomonas yunnanensis]|nr:phospholipase D family protein [Sphingomonas yunnanensis]
MKLIIDRTKLARELTRCIDRHDRLSFAVAWATPTKVYNSLLARRDAIESGVIGTHFYQTDPQVLDDFVDEGKVRFVLQPSGVFHPKIFLFRTGRRFDAFVGSANLTHGAMARNSEAVMHVSQDDDGAVTVRDELAEAIRTYRGMGRKVRQEDIDVYRAAHERMRSSRERLDGTYGSARSTSPLESEVMRMSWKQYVARVRDAGDDHLRNRIALLRDIRTQFARATSFAEMDVDVRAMIAGLPNGRTDNQGYFGSMRGDGYFHNAVKSSPGGISAALDCIPLEGPVTRQHYDSFVGVFAPAVAGERQRPGVASRLLAMKRPDLFVCISKRNRTALARDFSIAASRIDFDLYWSAIAERIRDARWWSQPRPAAGRELDIWLGRSAMLDAIFYE